MNDLLNIFNQASGLKAHHVSVSYPDLSIEFDGYDEAGNLFNIGSGPTDGDLDRHAARLGIFQKYRLMAKLETAINYAGNSAMSEGTDLKSLANQARARKASGVASFKAAVGNFNKAMDNLGAAEKQFNDDAMDLAQVTAELTNGAPENI